MQYSRITGSVRWSGGTLLLRAGQSIDDEHPLLAERPDLFTEQEPNAQVQPQRVQSTMQRPGEVRTERPAVVKAPPR